MAPTNCLVSVYALSNAMPVKLYCFLWQNSFFVWDWSLSSDAGRMQVRSPICGTLSFVPTLNTPLVIGRLCTPFCHPMDFALAELLEIMTFICKCQVRNLLVDHATAAFLFFLRVELTGKCSYVVLTKKTDRIGYVIIVYLQWGGLTISEVCTFYIITVLYKLIWLFNSIWIVFISITIHNHDNSFYV
jgi:hypothetical protein